MNNELAVAVVTITTKNSTYTLTLNPWESRLTSSRGTFAGVDYRLDPIMAIGSEDADLLIWWGEAVDTGDVASIDDDWANITGHSIRLRVYDPERESWGEVCTSPVQSVHWATAGGC